LSPSPITLKAQGDLPPAGNKPPEISAEELAKIDNQLAMLINLRHQWLEHYVKCLNKF
jgi:hypothetical protein